MQGSKVMRQSGAGTLGTEEPYELIAHVRDCGGAGWATTGSTRKPTPSAYGFRRGSPRAFGTTGAEETIEEKSHRCRGKQVFGNAP